MNFYLLRHPETIANRDKIIYGWTDYAYTVRGEKMVEEIPGNLSQLNFDMLYSSPLGRASKLAEAIAERKQMEVHYDDRIREMNFGILEGLKFEEAKVSHKEIMDQLFSDFTKFEVPEGESCGIVLNRAKSFFDEIKDDEGSCLVVAHAMLIHMSMAYLLDIDIKNIWRFIIEPGMLLHLEYKEGYGMLKSMIPYKEHQLQIGDQLAIAKG